MVLGSSGVRLFWCDRHFRKAVFLLALYWAIFGCRILSLSRVIYTTVLVSNWFFQLVDIFRPIVFASMGVDDEQVACVFLNSYLMI